MGAKREGNSGECRGMQGNARGTYGSWCKEPGEYRGMPEELMGVDAKCHGNAGEYRGMSGERMSVNCQGNAGNAGQCQGNGV